MSSRPCSGLKSATGSQSCPMPSSPAGGPSWACHPNRQDARRSVGPIRTSTSAADADASAVQRVLHYPQWRTGSVGCRRSTATSRVSPSVSCSVYRIAPYFAPIVVGFVFSVRWRRSRQVAALPKQRTSQAFRMPHISLARSVGRSDILRVNWSAGAFCAERYIEPQSARLRSSFGRAKIENAGLKASFFWREFLTAGPSDNQRGVIVCQEETFRLAAEAAGISARVPREALGQRLSGCKTPPPATQGRRAPRSGPGRWRAGGRPCPTR